jgi:hypothetical protein
MYLFVCHRTNTHQLQLVYIVTCYAVVKMSSLSNSSIKELKQVFKQSNINTYFFEKFLFFKYFSKDYITQLNNKEKTLSNKCYFDIERCAMIARLRKYLEEVSLFIYQRYVIF